MCAAKNSFKRIAKSKKLKKYVSLCSDNDTLDQEYKCVQRGRSAEQLTKLNHDSCLKNEFSCDFEDDEILFPYDASKRLSQQVEVLLEENGQLRRSLVEAEARLKGVVTKCPPGLASHGRASDLAASKIVELSKRVRELTADLEVAKMRCRAFELSSLTASQPPPPHSQEKVTTEDTKSQESEIKELTDKLSSANLKVCEYRNQCQQLKHELKMAQKALVSEIGEGVSVASILSGGSSWRGRAQQIQTLQQRVTELSEKTVNPELTEKEAKKAISAARLAEKELRVEHEKELSGLKDQLEDRQKKLDAAKARTRVLENSLSELRGRLAALLDKTSHDDQLISALTTQLANVSDKSQERSTTSRLEQHNKMLEQQLAEEKSKFTHLQSALHDKQEELAAMNEKFATFHSNLDIEASERSKIVPAESPHTNHPASETLGLAAEAERLRLLELLAVTNKRLENERQLATQAQDMLRRERHKAARLETKLARQELERVSARSGYQHTSPHKTSETITEELKYKVALLEEEVLYLRSRLTNVEQEKQDDLRTYTGMLEHTRHAFMDAVKNLGLTANYCL